ncbi:MAG: hypothetical protein A2583_08265 [Bdellovibrionales bacterium RIFOXYD1_FULL_53_11]|nr:MAG: hypothetical protein A2583_08265 [Bdellovibrionales bacterium RIFOXYD1_FULL_53_11]
MKRKKWLPVWAVVIVAFLAIGTVWLRLSIVGTTYSITQAEKTIRNLQIERELAEHKLAAMKSPRRLEQLARTKFGLSHPKAEQVVHIK